MIEQDEEQVVEIKPFITDINDLPEDLKNRIKQFTSRLYERKKSL